MEQRGKGARNAASGTLDVEEQPDRALRVHRVSCGREAIKNRGRGCQAENHKGEPEVTRGMRRSFRAGHRAVRLVSHYR